MTEPHLQKLLRERPDRVAVAPCQRILWDKSGNGPRSARQSHDREDDLNNDQYDYRSLHRQGPCFLSLRSVVLLGEPKKQVIAHLVCAGGLSSIDEKTVRGGQQGLHRSDAVLLKGLSQVRGNLCLANPKPSHSSLSEVEDTPRAGGLGGQDCNVRRRGDAGLSSYLLNFEVTPAFS